VYVLCGTGIVDLFAERFNGLMSRCWGRRMGRMRLLDEADCRSGSRQDESSVARSCVVRAQGEWGQDGAVGL